MRILLWDAVRYLRARYFYRAYEIVCRKCRLIGEDGWVLEETKSRSALDRSGFERKLAFGKAVKLGFLADGQQKAKEKKT